MEPPLRKLHTLDQEPCGSVLQFYCNVSIVYGYVSVVYCNVSVLYSIAFLFIAVDILAILIKYTGSRSYYFLFLFLEL